MSRTLTLHKDSHLPVYHRTHLSHFLNNPDVEPPPCHGSDEFWIVYLTSIQSKHPSYQFRKSNLNIGMFRRLFNAAKDGVKAALHALRVWAQQHPHTFKRILFAVLQSLAATAIVCVVVACIREILSVIISIFWSVYMRCLSEGSLPPNILLLQQC